MEYQRKPGFATGGFGVQRLAFGVRRLAESLRWAISPKARFSIVLLFCKSHEQPMNADH